MHRLLLTLLLAGCAIDEAPAPSADAGTPLRGAADYVGRTFVLDLAVATAIAPSGVGSLLASFVGPGDPVPAVTVLAVDPRRPGLRTRLGAVEDVGGVWQQDLCTPTLDSNGPGDVSRAPFVRTVFGPGPYGLLGVPQDAARARVGGTLQRSPFALVDAELDLRIDTRPLVPLVGGTAPGDVCDLYTAFSGLSCDECSPDDAHPDPYCLDLRVADMPGDEAVGITLVQRTEADIAADPACVP